MIKLYTVFAAKVSQTDSLTDAGHYYYWPQKEIAYDLSIVVSITLNMLNEYFQNTLYIL